MQGHGEAVPSHATLRKTYLPLEPENSEATGATQVASGTGPGASGLTATFGLGRAQPQRSTPTHLKLRSN